jgi:hypothetical protein
MDQDYLHLQQIVVLSALAQTARARIPAQFIELYCEWDCI